MDRSHSAQCTVHTVHSTQCTVHTVYSAQSTVAAEVPWAPAAALLRLLPALQTGLVAAAGWQQPGSSLASGH